MTFAQNIVTLLDAFDPNTDIVPSELDGAALLILESGDFTLAEYAQHQRPFPLNKTKAIMSDIIGALQACEHAKIVNADLKPQNIMYFRNATTFDRWKVIDFDAACRVGEVVKRSTIDYCSPEALRNLPSTHAMDMFSLGRILQFLVAHEGTIWSGRDFDLSLDDKEQLILDQSEELDVGGDKVIVHSAARRIVKHLLRKNPSERLALKELKESSFITGHIHTEMLRESPAITSETSRSSNRSTEMQPDAESVQQGRDFEPSGFSAMGSKILDKYLLIRPPAVTNGRVFIWQALEMGVAADVAIKFYVNRTEWAREVTILQRLGQQNCRNLPDFKDAFESTKDDSFNPYFVLVTDFCRVSLNHPSYRRNVATSQDSWRSTVKGEVVKALESIGIALRVLQHMGVAHCDIRPGEIMKYHAFAADPGTWRLVGFENARRFGEAVATATREYSSPELTLAIREGYPLPASQAVDMWGLGRTLYQLISPKSFWPEGIRKWTDKASVLLDSAEPFWITEGTEPIAVNALNGLLCRNPSNRWGLKEYQRLQNYYNQYTARDYAYVNGATFDFTISYPHWRKISADTDPAPLHSSLAQLPCTH